MSIKVPNNSEILMLKYVLGYTASGNQIMRLYVNAYLPSDTDTAASYTEMSTLGYTSKTLTSASWSIATVTGTATATYAQQTWAFSGGTPVQVYGYYVTDVSGNLLWAEAFTSSKTVQYTGDQILITPTITLSTT